MRLRNVPGSRDTIAKSDYCFDTPEDKKNQWNLYFNNTAPIHIEVGMGKLPLPKKIQTSITLVLKNIPVYLSVL